MNINIVGWYGKNNVGDEAFKNAHQEIFDGHSFEFITPPMKHTNPDIVVLGGGAVVSPFYLKTLPDCPRYAIGVDLAYESEAELLAQANFKEVYVRTQTDYEALKNKASCPVHPMPDLAFMIQPTGKDILSKYKKHPNKKTVGVFVTDYVNPAIDRPIEQFAERAWNFQINMADQLDKLHKQGYEVLLVPCSTGGYGDDRRINLDLAAFMETQPTNIFDTISPQDTVDLMAQLDLAVCMRFHSHIFAIIAGTPFVSIQFTRKVKLLLKENELTETLCCQFVDDEFDVGDFLPKLEMVKAGNYKERFLTIARRNYQELQRIKGQVRSNWLR